MNAAMAALVERLGYRFVDEALLQQALRHRSWCAQHPGYESNERLEFLGDAVLGWVVADLVYHRHLTSHEGRLTDLRKSVVNAQALAEIAREIGIGPCLAVAKGEAADIRDRVSVLSDAHEAVIAAVYLDGGPPAAHGLIVRLLGARLSPGEGDVVYGDFKTMLQELSKREFDSQPVYVVSEEGPAHAKQFFASVIVDGTVVGAGEGSSKKQAEQRAAREAFARLSGEAASGESGA